MPLSSFGRRHKHTFGKKKEKWDGAFRKPPKPDSYYKYLKMIQGYEPMQDILKGYENGGVVQNLYSMI